MTGPVDVWGMNFMRTEPARVYGILVAAITIIGSVTIATTTGYPAWIKTVIVVCAGLAPILQANLTRGSVFSPATVDQLTGRPQ